MTRVIVIEPGLPAEVREVDLSEGNSLATLQGLVGGLVDRLQVDHDVDAWFNDEGRFMGLPLNRFAFVPGSGWYDLLGTIVVAKFDDDGNTLGFDDDAELEHYLGVVRRWPQTWPYAELFL